MSSKKYVLVAFAVVFFASNVYGYDRNNDLPAPNNFHADIGQYGVELTWEDPDSSSNTLLGYYLYRLDIGKLSFFENIPIMPYFDFMVNRLEYYTYYATALYEEGESAPSITDSSYANIPYGWYHELFYIDWNSAGWHQEPPDGNWRWSPGYAYLNWSPIVLNYDMALFSPEFGSGSWFYDKIIFNMYIDDYSTDTGEMMEIWVMHDDEEDMIFQWDLDEHDDWGVSGGSYFEFDEMEQFNDQNVSLKFRSYGSTTFNFNYWYIYDILFGIYPGFGKLEGYVFDDNGEPIQEARVSAEQKYPYSKYYNVLTSSDGSYYIEPMLRGHYDLKFYAPGYSSVYLEDVKIENDSTSYYTVYLGVPTMSISPSEINDSIQIGAIDSTMISIENTGTGALEWSASFQNFSPSDDTTWIALSDSQGIVPSEDIEDIYITFDATDDSVNQVHTCDLIFESYPDIGTIQIPVTLTVTGYSVDDEYEESIYLLSTHPNPFSNSTTISYNKTMSSIELAQIRIYNIKGQLVRELKIQNLKLKINEAVWDGRDENGSDVAQGIYFYTIYSGDRVLATQKCLLLR